MAPADIAIGIATRPYPGEQVNGDAWQVDWHAGRCRIAVIDGLGHGPAAATAAAAALSVLAQHPELEPRAALQACHAALTETRGAAISIASVDAAAKCLTYVGVGNVEGHLWQAGRQSRLTAFRGIVGSAIPALHDLSFALQPEWLLLMHSDGVRARFQVELLSAELLTQPQLLAEGLLGGWSRATDDATIVVIRPRMNLLG